MISISTAENALKTVYLGTITDLLNTKSNPLLAKIEQTSSDVWGKEVRRSVSYGMNGGIAAGDETGDLPLANSKKFLQLVSTLKNLYGQIEISDKAVRASADGKGAFTDLLNNEIQSLLEASRFNLSRMLFGNGTGYITKMYPVASGYYPVLSVNCLMEGMVVEVVTPSGIPGDSNLKISLVDRVNKRIKFETPPTTNITDFLYIAIQKSFSNEIVGIEGVMSNDVLYGFNRNTYPILKAHQKTAVGAIDDIVIQQAIDYLDMQAGSTVDYIACAPDVKYAYQEYLAQYKRNIDIMQLEGGYKSLSFNGIPLVSERFIDDGIMYLLNTKAFKMHQLCDWRFLETENGNILRQKENKAVYTATLVKYCDLICDKPNGQAKLSGITRV